MARTSPGPGDGALLIGEGVVHLSLKGFLQHHSELRAGLVAHGQQVAAQQVGLGARLLHVQVGGLLQQPGPGMVRLTGQDGRRGPAHVVGLGAPYQPFDGHLQEIADSPTDDEGNSTAADEGVEQVAQVRRDGELGHEITLSRPYFFVKSSLTRLPKSLVQEGNIGAGVDQSRPR
jgi:hypothetical protein